MKNTPLNEQHAHILADIEKLENRSQEMEPVSPQSKRLPHASPTYVSIWTHDDVLFIAELSGYDVHLQKIVLHGRNATDEIIHWLKQTTKERDLHIIAANLQDQQQFDELKSKLWLQEDIVPYENCSQEFISEHSLEMQVDDLTRGIAARFNEDHIVTIQLTPLNEVQVADLVTLEDYRQTVSAADFQRLVSLAQAFQGKKLVFLNATPQGGGVALMRHALLRLLSLLDVDAHWYVLKPDRDVFAITKAKFHNVLQNVASPDVRLTNHDKELYMHWIAENAALLRSVFQQSDVFVIDDPQPAGLIPYIKQANPQAKIIYRSHIQVAADLVTQEGTPQQVTWQFLWKFIQQVDYFVSHPIRQFVPANVPPEKVLYMPATTDPLDGLNKPLSEEQMQRYMDLFNALVVEDGQTPLDPERDYIIQVARFDPSKGIPAVLESYRKLRLILQDKGIVPPQLVITGNGSVDDPDGVPVYNQTRTILQSEPYREIAADVKVIRLPHRDQILNTLLRKSKVVLQLSIKEGFEVKVTEALMKGKPVIAYKTGGIPLQIHDGVNGYLVEVGNTTLVAEHLLRLFTDCELYQQMSQAAAALANKDYQTVANALCWLFLANQLCDGHSLAGNFQWVKALAQHE
ncbi:MAG TPA: glycosyltransferase [Dictyobacter sp.]|jgi:glycosyltransferase involved in cell wall biosynthesis|nr:glycosyltransferase [Dictyobacter sp.]